VISFYLDFELLLNIVFQKTTAYRRLVDDVPPEIKQQRLIRMTSLFRREAEKLNQAQIGQQQLVLVEGVCSCQCL
jgi:tRNA A37 methylthiotransferase MiaB